MRAASARPPTAAHFARISWKHGLWRNVLNTPLHYAQVLERPRTAQLLRSVSNSFKKGTDRLKRGLTPRSRTSLQTIEPDDAVPPPPPPVEPSAQPMQLDNHVHVKIAEVSPQS